MQCLQRAFQAHKTLTRAVYVQDVHSWPLLLQQPLVDLVHSCGTSTAAAAALHTPTVLPVLLKMCSLPGDAGVKAGETARTALAGLLSCDSRTPELAIWLEHLPRLDWCRER